MIANEMTHDVFVKSIFKKIWVTAALMAEKKV